MKLTKFEINILKSDLSSPITKRREKSFKKFYKYIHKELTECASSIMVSWLMTNISRFFDYGKPYEYIRGLEERYPNFIITYDEDMDSLSISWSHFVSNTPISS